MPRRRIIVALLALVLAVPSAVFAQGAGDDQYQDPFGDEPAQNDGGQANGRAAQDDDGLEDEPPIGDDDGGNTNPTPPPEDPGDEPPEDPADEPKALPNTGSDPRAIAFLGLLFVLVGVGLRLRSIDPDAY